MNTKLVKLSKYLSKILRHDPGRIGLKLDPQGWAKVDDILRLSSQSISRKDLETVVAQNDKKRFTLSEDGKLIRAAQGHSIEIDLGLTHSTPPKLLYHGTAENRVELILSEGLKPMRRQHVHLSIDKETALKVGARHGKPAILLVDAEAMHADGKFFYQADNGVWLADDVPPTYLKRLLD